MKTITIIAVDGETIFAMSSKYNDKLLKFLKLYDHEGSSIFLEEDDKPDIDNPDIIYQELTQV